MINVCFTGRCEFWNRNVLTQKVQTVFNVQSSVSSTTDILVYAEPSSSSSKMKKAKRHGSKMMTYREFIDKYPEALI